MTTDQLGRVVDAWKGLNYSARGSVQRCAPTLANALNDAADQTERCTFVSPIGPYGRCTLPAGHGKGGGPAVHECDPAEQAQPLPPVDNVAGCDATDLGRRCVRLADHEDGHLFPPAVPAGPDRFA